LPDPQLPQLPPLPPGPPLPPLPSATPGVGTASALGTPRAAPRTAEELSGLRRQREELSSQLISAQRRRADVARAIRKADDPAIRAGLEQRLGVLDQRMLQLESDIAETGRLITSAPTSLLVASEPRGLVVLGARGPSANAVPALLLAVVILQIVLLARVRGLLRRGPAAHDPTARETAERMARLEHAVGAIAEEVERVGEGQRFVTRLLAEQRGQPERLPESQGVPYQAR
jgi:chromosome segregation ATPase